MTKVLEPAVAHERKGAQTMKEVRGDLMRTKTIEEIFGEGE
jgi:hypothetical protein